MENLNLEGIKKNINIEKFLFIKKEEQLHVKAFFGRTSLKAGVLICSIVSLIMSTAMGLHAIENYTFLFFLGYFVPNLTNMAGSIMMLLSIEMLEEKKAYWGYILTAVALWLHVGLIGLSLIFTLISNPKYFFENFITTILLVVFVIGVNAYSAWIDYCYAKHLALGNREVVESGRGEGLIAKEMAPAQNGPIGGNILPKNPQNIIDPEKQ
jgi:uncharacterized membrane protein YqjE